MFNSNGIIRMNFNLITTKFKNIIVIAFIYKIISLIRNNILLITIFTLLSLLCLYITFIQNTPLYHLVTILDDKESNIQSSLISKDNNLNFYSSIYNNGQFSGTYTSPWYIADRSFAIKIGGWYGHTYIPKIKQDLNIVIETEYGKFYQAPIAGVNRSYYNVMYINLDNKINQTLKFRIRSKGDSKSPFGWLSFSAPYYPEKKKVFSNFITKILNFFLIIILIYSICYFIYNKGTEIKFLLIFVSLLCYFIADYTPLGLVPYTPRSPDAPRIFISNDGSGYYVYLQELFINGFKAEGTVANYFLGDGKKVNLFLIGTSILESPFFLIAKTLSSLAKIPYRDGLNEIFQLFSAISNAFYFLLGIYFINKVLIQFTSNVNRLIVLLSIIFGLNVFVYATGTWGLNYSHIYSFSMISVFIYLITLFYNIKLEKNLYLFSIVIGISIGIITLIRIHNCLVVIILILYNISSIDELIFRIKTYFIYYFISLVSSLITYIPQCLWFYRDTGDFFFNYPKKYAEIAHKFDWLHPELINIMFSSRKGLFIWTPLWLFAFLIILLRSNQAKKWRYALTLYLPLRLYIGSSSADHWHSHGSFGQREFVDVAILCAIGLACYLETFKINYNNSQILKNKYFLLIIIILCLFLYNIIITKAFFIGIIPFDMANFSHINAAFTSLFM
jgi:hypothetical protein